MIDTKIPTERIHVDHANHAPETKGILLFFEAGEFCCALPAWTSLRAELRRCVHDDQLIYKHADHFAYETSFSGRDELAARLSWIIENLHPKWQSSAGAIVTSPRDPDTNN